MGNTRVVFTTDPKEIEFTLNYEGDPNNPDDESLFEDVQVAAIKDFNRTTGDPNYTNSQILRSSPNSQIGSAIAIPVGQGDKITAKAYAKYIAAAADPNVTAVSIASSLVSAFTGLAPTGFEGGTSTINSNFGSESLIGSAGFDYNTSAPKAFLNLMFLPDGEAITLVKDASFAYDQIANGTTETVINGISENVYDELLIEDFEAPASGYVMIYLSNEGSLSDIYFDDMAITVEEHPVIQKNDFYPFGLQHSGGYKRATAKENRYKFQGQEHIDDLDLNWDSFKWRNSDPAIGRFFNIDPLAENFYYNSPYAFSENKVTAHVELEGLESASIHRPSVRRSIRRPRSGGNTATISQLASEAARINNRPRGFATSSAREKAFFTRTSTHSTGNGTGGTNASSNFGRDTKSGNESNFDNTHGNGTNAGNVMKFAVDIVDRARDILGKADNIQVTESFNAGGFSLGSDLTVGDAGSTMLLNDLQQDYTNAAFDIARGDLSQDEFDNLDTGDRLLRIIGGFNTLQSTVGPSPLQLAEQRLSESKKEKEEETRVTTVSPN